MKSKAFTMIELIFVIIILSALASAFMGKFTEVNQHNTVLTNVEISTSTKQLSAETDTTNWE